MSTLLNKPIKIFSIYALIILACSIPIYFFMVQNLWMDEIDEQTEITKYRIAQFFENQKDSISNQKAFLFWKIIQPGTTIKPLNTSKIPHDRVYDITRDVQYGAEIENDRFRGLSTTIFINKKPYSLEIETNIQSADDIVLKIAFISLFLFAILVIGFILLNRLTSKQLWRPFRATLEKIKKYDLSKEKNISFGKTDIKEFEELNTEISKLIGRNISNYSQQKAFIETASHELQTPLAVLKTKIDLLLQCAGNTYEHLEIINAINLPLSRAIRINKNLLLLSKIENQQFLDKEPILLNKIFLDTIALLDEYSNEKEITINLFQNQQLQINCNLMLLEIFINNLLINAIKHNIKNGVINIKIENQILEICNSGTQPLNASTLFQRYMISTNEHSNSGLGLSIVQEICNRYQWKIDYLFQDKMHVFSIIF